MLHEILSFIILVWPLGFAGLSLPSRLGQDLSYKTYFEFGIRSRLPLLRCNRVRQFRPCACTSKSREP